MRWPWKKAETIKAEGAIRLPHLHSSETAFAPARWVEPLSAEEAAKRKFVQGVMEMAETLPRTSAASPKVAEMSSTDLPTSHDLGTTLPLLFDDTLRDNLDTVAGLASVKVVLEARCRRLPLKPELEAALVFGEAERATGKSNPWNRRPIGEVFQSEIPAMRTPIRVWCHYASEEKKYLLNGVLLVECEYVPGIWLFSIVTRAGADTCLIRTYFSEGTHNALRKHLEHLKLPDMTSPTNEVVSVARAANMPLTLASITIAAPFDPGEFYKNRPGLSVYGQDIEDMACEAKPAARGSTFAVYVADFGAEAPESQILNVLNPSGLSDRLLNMASFDKTTACAIVAEMITKQRNGERGILSIERANLLFVSSGVPKSWGATLRVRWKADKREWIVDAWPVASAHTWFTGFLFLFPAVRL